MLTAKHCFSYYNIEYNIEKHSSMHIFLLSSRLYCWCRIGPAQPQNPVYVKTYRCFAGRRLVGIASASLPVGNFTQPRRTSFCILVIILIQMCGKSNHFYLSIIRIINHFKFSLT